MPHLLRVGTPIRVFLLVGVVAAMLSSACGGDNNAAAPVASIEYRTPTTVPATSSSIQGSSLSQQVSVDITARDTAFDKKAITMPAGAMVTIHMTNEDAIFHNIAFYPTKEGKDAFFTGEIFSGPGQVKDGSFTAPAQTGSYYFRCDVHPDQMNGTFSVK